MKYINLRSIPKPQIEGIDFQTSQQRNFHLFVVIKLIYNFPIIELYLSQESQFTIEERNHKDHNLNHNNSITSK